MNKQSFTKEIYDLNLFFGFDKFSPQMVKSLTNHQKDENELSALHDFYIQKRITTLEDSYTSVPMELPKELKQNGVFQTVEGGRKYDKKLMYFFATIEKNRNYYVFQLVGKSENMGYLKDDFFTILKSIH